MTGGSGAIGVDSDATGGGVHRGKRSGWYGADSSRGGEVRRLAMTSLTVLARLGMKMRDRRIALATKTEEITLRGVIMPVAPSDSGHQDFELPVFDLLLKQLRLIEFPHGYWSRPREVLKSQSPSSSRPRDAVVQKAALARARRQRRRGCLEEKVEAVEA